MFNILDAFCCAGGAAKGYQRAGFYVVGVDINPQPNYVGDEFHQGDAIEFIREHGHEFDFIHTSPPCQKNSALTKGTNKETRAHLHVDLIPPTREALKAVGQPWVIENVPGADMRKDLMLCGEMFGLQVIRHRYFEFSDDLEVYKLDHLKHRGRVAGYRHGKWYDGPYFAVYGEGGGKGTVAQWQDAMDIHWTDVRKEIAEAIPPAYTEYIGSFVSKQLFTSSLPKAA